MATMWAYVAYVATPTKTRYLLMTLLFVLGLMAKPMLVTLPFILLLLDFWPLRRFTLREASNLPQLLREKIPLLILTILSSIVTFVAQRAGGSVVDAIPIATRVSNAFVAYFAYLQRMLWPTRLAILYPAVLTTRDWWWLAALGVVAIS